LEAPNGPTAYGIRVDDSSDCTVIGNNVSDCIGAVHLGNASNCAVNGNLLKGNSQGIRMYSPGANNTFYENTVENSTYDGIIDNSFGGAFLNNSLFHNNFLNNTSPFIYNVYTPSGFTWDNGVEGNFWSDYTGPDGNMDGLGDTPYSLDAQTHDDHPLMGCFQAFEVPYNGSLQCVNVITNSTILNFSYGQPTKTIMLTVNGSDGSIGFCRISVPHDLTEPELAVVIDNGSVEVLHANYTLLDDGSSRWIYFAYSHSIHEIQIIPEFHFLIFLWFVWALAFTLLLRRSK
jgi:parallel beta-helix repeat protein